MEECLTLQHRCFSRFLNCTKGTKSRNLPQIMETLFVNGFSIIKLLKE